MEISSKLKSICKLKENVDLKTMCSMHVGGVGAYVCYPKTIKELKKLLEYLNINRIPFFLLGNGTNVIFEDGGFSAVLICFKELNKYKVKKNTIIAESGMNLFALNNICKQEGLSGLEWSYGIPGSVGGAICMNAGAYGSEMKDFVKTIWVLRKGRVKKIKIQEMGFGYRTSIFKTNGDIIIKASFCLKKEDHSKIEAKQKEIFAYRKCCQPYGTFNSGSMFKKTVEGSAGKTIDKLGLKGVKIGDIQISDKHANFFINLGNGTSEDLHKLIAFTKSVVKEKTGIELQEEVIFVKDKKE